MSQPTFPLLILTGRPAAGKSEVIDYVKHVDQAERARRFHISNVEEIDDFIYVWETFEIDDILSRYGKRRIWTDERYFFTDHFVWNLFIERMNLAYRKKLAAEPDYHKGTTTLIEFARGGTNGIEEALGFFHEKILKRAALIYIRVPFEQSIKRNRRRARAGEEDSILYHSLPDEKMDFYYKTNDWEKLEAMDPEFITVKDSKIPYAVFENEPEKTQDPKLIGEELERVTSKLWASVTKSGAFAF